MSDPLSPADLDHYARLIEIAQLDIDDGGMPGDVGDARELVAQVAHVSAILLRCARQQGTRIRELERELEEFKSGAYWREADKAIRDKRRQYEEFKMLALAGIEDKDR